jgi:hypothetical protein
MPHLLAGHLSAVLRQFPSVFRPRRKSWCVTETPVVAIIVAFALGAVIKDLLLHHRAQAVFENPRVWRAGHMYCFVLVLPNHQSIVV